jgi:hypothetical protein
MVETKGGRRPAGKASASRGAALGLDNDAKRIWIAYYNEHGHEQEAAEDGAEAAALGKLEGAAARLALVVHAVRAVECEGSAEPNLIDALSMQSGVRLARWFIEQARLVYAEFSASPEEREQRKLVDWIEGRGGRVTAAAVQTGVRRYRKSGAAKAALQRLVDAELGSWEEDAPTSSGGRPTRLFVLARVSRANVSETPPDCAPERGFADTDNDDGPCVEADAPSNDRWEH